MVLLSGLMRQAAITGSTSDSLFGAIAGRQGDAWAQRTVGGALPTERPPAERDALLRELEDLRHRGVVTDGELRVLRHRLHV
jgi:hypothetical protein